MASNRNKKHFGNDKKSHTKIKHAIFSKTLAASISIANNLCRKKPNNYTYLDLFAGSGVFEDGSPGSPMIALDLFINHAKHQNCFPKIVMLNIEKNEDSYASLKTSLGKKIDTDWDQSLCTGNLEIGYGNNSWENYGYELKNRLSKNSWGFIFADPFSTELDLKKFIDTIKNNSNVKDIMIFANFNTLTRQNGRLCSNDADRIAKTLGVSVDDLTSNEDFSNRFKAAFSSQLKSFKDFAIGVAFPVEVKNKGLITADYFYLILGTNSIKVADAFLMAYADELSKNKKNLLHDTLFSDESIVEYLKSNPSGVTLFELLEHLFNNFMSWKNCDSATEVPTIAATVSKINKLIDSKEIELINHSDELIYKRNNQSKGSKIGHIKSNAISSKRDAESIVMKYTAPIGQQALPF